MLLKEKNDIVLFETTEQVTAIVRCKVIGTPYAYTKLITCTSIYEQVFGSDLLLVFYLNDEVVFDTKAEKIISIYIDGNNVW